MARETSNKPRNRGARQKTSRATSTPATVPSATRTGPKPVVLLNDFRSLQERTTKPLLNGGPGAAKRPRTAAKSALQGPLARNK